MKDQFLSPEGKQAKLSAGLKNARDTIARQQQAVLARQAEFEHDERRFYTPTALEPTDAVGAIADWEARNWWSALDQDSQRRFLPEMAAGNQDALLTALMRSPVQIDLTGEVDKAWREVREKRRPQKADSLSRRRESIEWASTVLRGLADRVPSDLTISRLLSRIEQNRAA